MSSGIYYYIDNKTGKIVYIGKDSYIDKCRRHCEHLSSCHYNRQHINKVLQNNLERYEYGIFFDGCISEKILNGFEKAFIRRYNPIFNFTEGGEGVTGWKHSEDTRKKLSELKKGKYGKHHSEKTKQKMSIVRNKTGYFRVSKRKCSTCKQGFRWRYCYTDKYGKRKDITSISIDKLKEKVISNHLIWVEFNTKEE